MSGPIPIPVVSEGFSWTAGGAWATFLALLTLIIRQVGPWRKQASDEQQLLVGNLQDTIKVVTDRLDKVEKQLSTERRLHYIELRRLEARYAAQRALDQHKFNNREQCLDALLRILELSPEKAREAAKRARQQITEQRRSEQLEADEIHKAEIAAVAVAEKELEEQEKYDDS